MRQFCWIVTAAMLAAVPTVADAQTDRYDIGPGVSLVSDNGNPGLNLAPGAYSLVGQVFTAPVVTPGTAGRARWDVFRFGYMAFGNFGITGAGTQFRFGIARLDDTFHIVDPLYSTMATTYDPFAYSVPQPETIYYVYQDFPGAATPPGIPLISGGQYVFFAQLVSADPANAGVIARFQTSGGDDVYPGGGFYAVSASTGAITRGTGDLGFGVTVDVTPTPEPVTLALTLGGLAVLGAGAWRRRRA